MLGNPFCHSGEVVGHGAGVEDVTGGVAEEDRAVGDVGLDLEHADAVVELVDDIVGLVGGGIVGLDEGRVVSADLGDVAVFAVAELDVQVAGRLVGGLRACGGGGAGLVEGVGGSTAGEGQDVGRGGGGCGRGGRAAGD